MPLPLLRLARFTVSVISLVWLCAGTAGAQQLPSLTYTTNDGLAHDIVSRLLQDPRGFLWAGGATAIMRFDGEKFAAYGRPAGLDVGTGVNDLFLGTQNDLWIATNGGGIFRFDLATADRDKRFVQLRIGEGRASNRVNAFLIRTDGEIWAGTDSGLFVARADRRFERVTLPVRSGQAQDAVHVTAFAASDSSIWIGTTTGLYHCRAATPTGCSSIAPTLVRSLLVTPDQHLSVGTDDGIQRWLFDQTGAPTSHTETIGKGLRITRLRQASNGALFGTDDGRVFAYDGRTVQLQFTLPEPGRVLDVTEDATRNLWVGTTRGLVAVRRQGITLFSTANGLRQASTTRSRWHPRRIRSRSSSSASRGASAKR